MNDLLVQENEQLKELDESKAKQIKAVFAPMVEMLEGFEAEYKNVMALDISPDKCKQAKKLRIAVSKVRTNADKVRKAQKEEYLRAGNAIQGVYNILKFAVVDKEEKLKDIETHFERMEADRIASLEISRVADLEKYDVDGSTMNLGNMPDEVWKNYLSGVKNNFESVKEAERKAEADRIETEKKHVLYTERNNMLSPYEKIRREYEKLKIEAAKKALEEKKTLSAPDKEKLFSVAKKLRNTKTTVKSSKAKKALEEAAKLLDIVANDM